MNLTLLFNFTKQDLLDRYSGSMLGALWTLLLPLINILIFIVVFSKLMGAQLPGSSSTQSYSIYLIAGLLAWTAFANTVNRATRTFHDQSHLIRKIRVSLPHLPLYIVLSESAVFAISLSGFLVFMLATGNLPHRSIILLPFVFITQQILAYALGLLLAILNVFIRDIQEFVGVALQMGFWLTPILYVPDILPESFQTLLAYNPCYYFIRAYQSMFILNAPIDTGQLIILVILAHSLLAGAYLLFKRLEKDLRDFV